MPALSATICPPNPAFVPMMTGIVADNAPRATWSSRFAKVCPVPESNTAIGNGCVAAMAGDTARSFIPRAYALCPVAASGKVMRFRIRMTRETRKLNHKVTNIQRTRENYLCNSFWFLCVFVTLWLSLFPFVAQARAAARGVPVKWRYNSRAIR